MIIILIPTFPVYPLLREKVFKKKFVRRNNWETGKYSVKSMV